MQNATLLSPTEDCQSGYNCVVFFYMCIILNNWSSLFFAIQMSHPVDFVCEVLSPCCSVLSCGSTQKWTSAGRFQRDSAAAPPHRWFSQSPWMFIGLLKAIHQQQCVALPGEVLCHHFCSLCRYLNQMNLSTSVKPTSVYNFYLKMLR